MEGGRDGGRKGWREEGKESIIIESAVLYRQSYICILITIMQLKIIQTHIIVSMPQPLFLE